MLDSKRRPAQVGKSPVAAPATNPERVLRFWRDVELFNLPTAPVPQRGDENLRICELDPDDLLPWDESACRGDSQRMWVHSVYLGVAKKVDIYKAVVAAAVPGGAVTEFETERVTGSTWLAAFAVDEFGRPDLRTYVRASFLVGLEKLRKRADLDGISAEIAKAAVEFSMRHGIATDQQATTGADSTRLGVVDLRDELDHVRGSLRGIAEGIELGVTVKSVRRRRPKDTDAPTAPAVDFLNSFYLNDLDILIKEVRSDRSIGAPLAAYLGPGVPPPGRKDVLASARWMAELIPASRLPTGRWPASSKHPLSLAQQAAVFESLHRLAEGSGLLAVNGPPGTGKSTLLSDIIADIVVRRARRIATLEDPWDLFGTAVTVAGAKVYPLRETIAGNDGIVVTSSNNTAVENISRELPAAAKIAAEEFSEAGYFPEVARSVFAAAEIEETPWGLVAGALGNAANRAIFMRGFFRSAPKSDGTDAKHEHLPTLHLVLEDAYRDRAGWERNWRSAREEFTKAVGAVDGERQRLIQLDALRQRLANLEVDLEALKAKLVKAESAVAAFDRTHTLALGLEDETLERLERALATAVADLDCHTLALQAAKDRLLNEEQREKPSVWRRWVRMLGVDMAAHRGWRERTGAARETQAKAAEALGGVLRIAKSATAALEDAKRRIDRAREQRSHEREALIRERDQVSNHISVAEAACRTVAEEIEGASADGIIVPDSRFWDRPAGERHLKSAWVNPRLDHLRSAAFLAALRLHEATIKACAGRFIANLRAWTSMLAGKLLEPIEAKDRLLLWDTLFFCVPVVSTTLASFDHLFDGMGKGSIGWVLVDEAGQATPQSAAGALWRARRAVVVGDPLQVEPVVTVPIALIRRLVERWPGLDDTWSPATQSVQTLADRTMTYGAWVGSDVDERVWTGLPLRAHRRCASPMFDIANRIAYDGQMVQATPTIGDFQCVLGESAWFDIRAERASGHVVSEEMEALAHMLKTMAADWPGSAKTSKLARVYVISPFRSVAERTMAVARESGAPAGRMDCGTVHAFQGKEAEIVILVLGSAPGPSGTGSRKWAALKPNLLNVAVTRAKLRLYVIGDRSAWGSCRYFDELAASLPVLHGGWTPARVDGMVQGSRGA